MADKRRIIASLRRQGYKITPQRKAIIDTILSGREHLTAAELFEKLQNKHPAIGLVTVYRTLEILDKIGLICEVHVEGNQRSFLIKRPQKHHHHLVCSDCGIVVDFTHCDLGDVEAGLSRQTGFHIKSHLLEFYGQCDNCQRMASA